MKPSLKEEKKLWRKGYKRVACLDEAGRGPLSGPVVAAAVMLINPKQIPNSKFQRSKHVWNLENCDLDVVSNFVLRASNLELRDSKKLSPKVREKFYKILTTDPQIEWGIGKVSEKVIDKINILEATKLAMGKAIENLEKKRKKEKIQKTGDRSNFVLVDFLILDGKMKLDLPIPQKSIVKADEKVFSCAAASIIAKVTRDRIMIEYHEKYPKYGFDRHKGYPTRLHFKMLRKYGPCEIHRRSFAPVFKNLKLKA